MHRMANLDTSWESIEDESTHFSLEHFNEIGVSRKVFFRTVNRRGEVAVKPAGYINHLLLGLALDDQTRRTENFVAEVWVVHK